MYSVIHTDGSGEQDPPFESLSELYNELSCADAEHGDVAVVHEDSGWSISAHRDGRVVMEHLGNGGERHMTNATKNSVIALWARLINGEIDGLLTEPWSPGYVAR